MEEAINTDGANVLKPRSKYVWLSVLILFVAIACFFFYKKLNIHKNEVHYHAGFQVYVDGQLQDFSDIKYMTLGSCGDLEEDEQLERAHLHDNIGDVVHVHRSGATWGDLFKNLNYSFDNSKQVSTYVNSEPVSDIFNYPINAYDSVVIFSGENLEKAQYLEKSVTKEHILEVESRSESCSD